MLNRIFSSTHNFLLGTSFYLLKYISIFLTARNKKKNILTDLPLNFSYFIFLAQNLLMLMIKIFYSSLATFSVYFSTLSLTLPTLHSLTWHVIYYIFILFISLSESLTKATIFLLLSA